MLRPWPVREDELVRALCETNNRSLESAVVDHQRACVGKLN